MLKPAYVNSDMERDLFRKLVIDAESHTKEKVDRTALLREVYTQHAVNKAMEMDRLQGKEILKFQLAQWLANKSLAVVTELRNTFDRTVNTLDATLGTSIYKLDQLLHSMPAVTTSALSKTPDYLEIERHKELVKSLRFNKENNDGELPEVRNRLRAEVGKKLNSVLLSK